MTCRNAKKGEEEAIGWGDNILCFGMNLKGLMFMLALYDLKKKSISPSQCWLLDSFYVQLFLCNP